MLKLPRTFFEHPTLEVAPSLIGKGLVRKLSSELLVGRIVEVEAYIGPDDRASHTFGGRRTARNEAMFGPAGHAYVYIIYGIHHCLNCVTVGSGHPEGVLIRAVEPLKGLDTMAYHRFQKSYPSLTTKERLQLTNGPGKLGQAFGIRRDDFNGIDLQGNELYIADLQDEAPEILTSPRIGIDNSGEAAAYPWRFYERDQPYVSKAPRRPANL